MRKFTLFMMSLFLMLGTAMAQNYSLTETGISSEELNAKTAPTLIAIKNLSRTNNYYFVGNTGAVPYSAADFSDAAVFVWQPVEEGVAGSYYLMKLDGTYMQATSPKDFGTVDGAAVFTTTNPTTTGTESAYFNGDGDSQGYIVDEALLVRFVNAAGTWINVQNGDAGTPQYNSGKGGWTIHHVYAVEEAAVEPEPEAPFEVVAVTPSEAVAELSTITVEFSEEIAGEQDLMAMETIYVGSRTNACNFTVDGKVLTITLWTPITAPGEYALKVPASVGITRASNGEAVVIDGEITFTVEEAPAAPFEVVAVTPSEAVTELSTITVEFSEEIAGEQDLMAMETIYVGSRTNACNFTVDGKVLTITLWTPITAPGEYALKVPASVGITRASNGEAVVIDGEITFTVEEPTPEPEVIPAANKSYTVVAEGHTTVSRPQWAINDEGTAFVSTGNTTVSTEEQKQFAFVTYNEATYIYSVSAKKFVMMDASLSDKNPDAVMMTELENGKFFFKFDDNHNVNIGGSGQMTIDWWSTIDGGNQFTLTEASDFDAAEALALLSAAPEPETPFEVVAVTPSEAVTELSTITVEFSEEIAGEQDLMAMETIYVGSRTNACNFTVDGKVLTITLWTSITAAGEYGLYIPESVGITRASNGEAVTMNGEYVFTVKEAGSIKDDNTIALIESANEILAIEGVGYPATTPREALKAAIAAAEEKPDTEAGTALQAAIDAYYATTDVVLPEGDKVYSLTMVAKNGNKFYLNYTGSDIAMVARTTDEELPNSAKFAAEDNGDGTVSLKTIDGKYLVYHSKYAGLSWLQGGGDTDGLQETKDDMTNITFAKMVNGNKVEATDDEQIFGMLTWYGKRGYDTGKSEDCYGYMVLMTDGSNYDGASVPFWNDGYSSAFIVEETEYIAEPLNVVAVTPAEDEVVNSLREITIEFDAEIAVKELSGTERISIDYGWGVLIGTTATVEGKLLKLVADTEIKDNGTYPLTIPAGVVTRVSDGVAYEGGTFTFTVEKAAVVVEPLTVVAVTPAEAVETLETITIEFSDNVDVPATASGKFTIADADGNTVATLYAWDAVVEGKIVTLTLAEAITTAGEYTFSFAEGLVARQGDQATCAYTCTITVTGGTGIDGINGEAGDSVIYDITGRKIEKITEGGIYIINGKKVLVK